MLRKRYYVEITGPGVLNPEIKAQAGYCIKALTENTAWTKGVRAYERQHGRRFTEAHTASVHALR